MRKRQIYIYQECSQPEDGWFKACILCYTITAQTLLFDKVEKQGVQVEQLVHVCPECKRAMIIDEQLRIAYKNAVSRYIAYH